MGEYHPDLRCSITPAMLKQLLQNALLPQVYPITTNPGVATGDGMAMAGRAGAEMGGMEFVQFHPTGFYSGKPAAAGRTFLI